jgi:hypothetical protein
VDLGGLVEADEMDRFDRCARGLEPSRGVRDAVDDIGLGEVDELL